MESEFKEVEAGPLKDLLRKTYNVHSRTLPVTHIPTNHVLPDNFLKIANDIKKLEVYDDDIWLITFPKSGTTWSQELSWLVNNDLDYEGAKTYMDLRFPYLEMTQHVDFTEALANTEKKNNEKSAAVIDFLVNSVEYIEKLSRPRHIKSHLHWDLLPAQLHQKKPKIIYVHRNPKDACISFYHFYCAFEGFVGTLEEFVELFLAGLVHSTPYWDHVLKFWEHRNDSNILFITYEELKMDLRSVVEKVAKFLGKTVKEEEMAQLLKHLSFEEMKNNPAVNNEFLKTVANEIYQTPNTDAQFMRKGKVGSWKEELSPDVIKRFDEWIEKNTKGTGITF